MQLVDSYLTEVSRFLPAAQREDVVGELRATIEEELAERASAHGRTPTPDDEAAVLARFGHPLKVASGYQSRSYLIGPELFPAFRETLGTLAVLVLAAQLLIALAVSASTGWTLSLTALLSQVLDSLLWMAVIVTLVFVCIEGAGTRLRWYDTWEPTSLARGAVSVVDRGNLISNLISEGVFLLWWNGALPLRNWLPHWSDGGEPLSFTLAGPWAPLFWPLNLVFGAFFLLHVSVLVRGLWQRTALVAELVLGIGGIGAAAALLLQDGALVVVTGPLDGFSLASFQRGVSGCLALVAGIMAWDVLKAARLLRR